MSEPAQTRGKPNVCPVCGASVTDKGRGTGVFDGPLGSGITFASSCNRCGAKLDGNQYHDGDTIYWRRELTPDDEGRLYFESLGPEIGPELCRNRDCNRKTLESSVMCQRHHFEMIEKKPCPF